MKRNQFLLLTALSALTLAGCSKSGDTVAPVPPIPSPADLLVRTWNFAQTTIKTDAKSYSLATPKGNLISDDNTLTFAKGGKLSYPDGGQLVTGKWALSNNDKTLTITDAYNDATAWTINSVSATDLELASMSVDITKGNDFTNTKVYSQPEQDVAIPALFMLALLDKSKGGTVDFSKEPNPKSVQLIIKGKAQ